MTRNSPSQSEPKAKRNRGVLSGGSDTKEPPVTKPGGLGEETVISDGGSSDTGSGSGTKTGLGED